MLNALCNVTLHLLGQAIWGDTWKSTVEKGKRNANNMTLHHLMQALWGHVWEHTVDKSQTNAANATMPVLSKAIWGDIWGDVWQRTVEKSQTNATNVTLHPLTEVLWGYICRDTNHLRMMAICHLELPLCGLIWKHDNPWCIVGIQFDEININSLSLDGKNKFSVGAKKGVYCLLIC